MRQPTTAAKIERLMAEIGARARGPGTVYFVGGTTAVALGFRESTKDVDLELDPEPAGVFEALRDLKDELRINIELAAPSHFLPPVPGWQQRSRFIARHGQVDFYHYDLVSQALAKVERGHAQDLEDVRAWTRGGLIAPSDLLHGYASIEPTLLRYPAVDPGTLRARVQAMAQELQRA